MRKFIPYLFLFFVSQNLFPQQKQLNSSEIKLGLEKLNVVGSVLYIAAHPDDENTRLLAYLANERKLRTGYLALTRGDGGQNLIGNEQGEELGLIRTQELLAARRTDGAEQFFTRANDFGFSKNPEETFKIWDKNLILSDVVWVIRKFRPDVIITRFPEDGRGGHGHHTASAILAHEAFSAAADPKRFPEQLKYVQPWQAKRIMWNTFNFGGNNTTSEDQLKINVGGSNPLLGKSYGEIAAESRTNHKSQGFGTAAQRGDSFEYFSLTQGEPAKNDLLDGIDVSWNRISESKSISDKILTINKNFKVDEPSASVKDLVELLGMTEKTGDQYWRAQKTTEVRNLIAACAGLWFESIASSPMAILHEPVEIKNSVLISSDVAVKLIRISSTDKANNAGSLLEKGKIINQPLTLAFSKLTQPYWLANKHGVGMYTITDQNLVGNPENPDLPATVFTFELDGKQISFSRPVTYKRTDPVEGEVYQKLAVVPAVSVSPDKTLFLLSDQTEKQISVSILANKPGADGKISLEADKSISTGKVSLPFSLKNQGDIAHIDLSIKSSAVTSNGSVNEAPFINPASKDYYRELKTISYPHIPKITYMPVATIKYASLDLKTGGKNIGYLPGAGDKVADALTQVGYSVTQLTDADVLSRDLSKFDAIITGVRLYNVSYNTRALNEKLLAYVNNGGVMLVQYNVNSNLKNNNIGPYPFTVSNSRVTDENASVTFTNPQSKVLNYPNKITSKDFDGWIQERGLYFASAIDSKYETPLAMNDPGENLNNGSLLITNYGKGKFVYTSLVFFRELPAGVPGAYRLFANLLAN